ncbi:MAG: hypothetical protein QMB71_04065, partial [Tolumonas sp.]
MQTSVTRALARNFLGSTPKWYKITILLFLVINPFLVAANPFFAGWVL